MFSHGSAGSQAINTLSPKIEMTSESENLPAGITKCEKLVHHGSSSLFVTMDNDLVLSVTNVNTVTGEFKINLLKQVRDRKTSQIERIAIFSVLCDRSGVLEFSQPEKRYPTSRIGGPMIANLIVDHAIAQAQKSAKAAIAAKKLLGNHKGETGPLHCKKASKEEARKAMSYPNDLNEDWTSLRLPQPPKKLSRETSHWLLSLPATVRPLQLAKRFPRIANKLHELNSHPKKLKSYLDDLLAVRRGKYIRQGLPPRIASEIVRLIAWLHN